MWCNIAVNKSPIILPYVLQCISHTHILNHSQCKDTAWEEAFYAIEERIFFTLKHIHKSSLLIILAFWFFWVSQFLTSEELCWHLFCEGLNLNQIQRCHVPTIKRFWHDKILKIHLCEIHVKVSYIKVHYSNSKKSHTKRGYCITRNLLQ